MFDHFPPELRNSVAGIAGSLVALAFLRRPPLQMFGLFIGGCLLAHYGTQWIALLFDMEKFDGLIGFLTGMMGMRIVEKTYELLEVVDVKDLWLRVLKRLGLHAEG
jgi:hypothetical protein